MEMNRMMIMKILHSILDVSEHREVSEGTISRDNKWRMDRQLEETALCLRDRNIIARQARRFSVTWYQDDEQRLNDLSIISFVDFLSLYGHFGGVSLTKYSK